MVTEGLETIAIVVSTAIGAGSVLAAAITYRKAEVRRRKEFVAVEYRRFMGVEAVQLVWAILDGAGKDVIVKDKNVTPMPYKELFGALRPHANDDEVFQPWEVELRDHFDVFLMELVAFAQYLKSGLVKKEDLLPYLDLFLKLMCGRAWISPEDASLLWAYIDFYGFESVRWLAQTLICDPPTALNANQVPNLAT